MTYIEKELQYISGTMHVKEVCALLNQAHKLQVGTQQCCWRATTATATSPTAPSRCRPSTSSSSSRAATPTATCRPPLSI
eukprot:3154565-Pleurochrysis_carterae.AAC.1